MTKNILAALVAALVMSLVACSGHPITPTQPQPATRMVAVPKAKTTGFKLDLGTCTDTAAVLAAHTTQADHVDIEWVPADSAAARAVTTPKLALATDRSMRDYPEQLALATDRDSCSL